MQKCEHFADQARQLRTNIIRYFRGSVVSSAEGYVYLMEKPIVHRMTELPFASPNNESPTYNCRV